MASEKLPEVAFFPALRLAGNVRLGEWIVGTPPADVLWRSPRFKELTTSLISSLADRGFHDAAVVWHREHGVDGVALSERIALAVERAIRFAVLDANDHIGDRLNKAHHLATSENATLYLQPIQEGDGSITHLGGGFWRRTLTGGWHIGERPLQLPEAVSATLNATRVSGKLASAVFDACLNDNDPTHRRAAVALEWHANVMANSPAVTMQQRIIALKTAFETLLGSSNSRTGAQKLRKLFASASLPHHDLLPWTGLIWSPTDRTDIAGTFKDENGNLQSCKRTELEAWFMALADARNTIIHEGSLPTLRYGPPLERPHSRYAGHLLEIGERILREAIKASLGTETLLCGLLVPHRRMEKLLRELFAGTEDPLESPGAVEESRGATDRRPAPSESIAELPESATSPRTLAALLAELGCDAANKVLVAHVHCDSPGMSIVKCGSVEIGVDRSELATLKDAGAENELPDYFEMCD